LDSKLAPAPACPTLGITSSGQDAPSTYRLAGTPKTVHWGYFSPLLKPVLTINSGDIVSIDSPHGDPNVYEAAGAPASTIPQSLKDIYTEVKERGPAVHILVGPIYIKGAEPGDTLEVQIHDLRITFPFGYNTNRYGQGTLPEDFPYTATRVIKLDLERMTSEVLPGIVVPLRPFWGILGVAPPNAVGRISSGPPGVHGGNLDLKELVPGATLFLPVHQKGGLFSAGDFHAVQGDGEVDQTALEAEGAGTFRFIVHKNRRLKWPMAETPTHYITMGLHEDLDVAAKMAVKNMIEFLAETKGINAEHGYMLASLAVDLRVTQIVDGVKGIHAMIAKDIFH
jgi:acetamidase/formamidase